MLIILIVNCFLALLLLKSNQTSKRFDNYTPSIGVKIKRNNIKFKKLNKINFILIERPRLHGGIRKFYTITHALLASKKFYNHFTSKIIL